MGFLGYQAYLDLVRCLVLVLFLLVNGSVSIKRLSFALIDCVLISVGVYIGINGYGGVVSGLLWLIRALRRVEVSLLPPGKTDRGRVIIGS